MKGQMRHIVLVNEDVAYSDDRYILQEGHAACT